MKLVNPKYLKKDKYYMYYRSQSSTCHKVLMVFTIDNGLSVTYDADKNGRKVERWRGNGRSYVYCISHKNTHESNKIPLRIEDPDNYDGGFQFNNTPPSFYELTDEEAHLQLINHL